MQNRLAIFLLLLLSLFGIRQLFYPGFYDSHDGAYHLIRLHQFHIALTNGQMPVRWAPTLFGGLGYPLFIVNYTLPYYLAEGFHLLGFSLSWAFKATLIFTYCLSTLFMYRFLRFHFNVFSAFFGALLFAIAPYRFANIFTRGALGESVAIASVPLVFLAIQSIKEKKTWAIPFCSLMISILVLSHTLVFVVMTPLFMVYALYLYRLQKTHWRSFGISILLAFGLCAFQTLPGIFERQYMQFDAKLSQLYKDHFLSLAQLFRIPVRNVSISTPFQVGLAHTLVVFVVVLLMLRKQRYRLLQTIFLGGFIYGILFTTNWSYSLWQKIPFLATILYPWRFLTVTTFSTAILGSALVSQGKRLTHVFAIIMLFAAFFASRHYMQYTTPLNRPETVFENDQETGTTAMEFTPVGVSADIVRFSHPAVEVIAGQADITSITKKPLEWQLKVTAVTEVFVKVAILSFPGWTVEIDGSESPYNAQYGKYAGLITLYLTKGSHTIYLVFKETPLRNAANTISALSFLSILGIMALQRRRFL